MSPVPVAVLRALVPVLLGLLVSVQSDRHSLTYIYTALSRPPEVSGVHQFTAMGLLDGRVIDYYDSERQQKVPRQRWMKTQLPAYYWDKGTNSRKSKQQWFKVNIDILMKRLNQTDNDMHVLQWRHGCEAESQADGNLTFSRGMDMYNYDGDDFLSFDDAHEVWVAPVVPAQETKRKWDNVQVLKEYTRGYLKNECMNWLRKFVTFSQQEMRAAKKPDIYVYATPARDPDNVVLRCFATGFYPEDIVVLVKRNGRMLSKEDGLKTTGVRPNDDDTFQVRYHVEIRRSDPSRYTCEVIHDASNLHTETEWDHVIPEPECGSAGLVGGVVGGVLVLVLVGVVGVVLVVIKRRRAEEAAKPTPETAAESQMLNFESKSSQDNGSDSGHSSESQMLNFESKSSQDNGSDSGHSSEGSAKALLQAASTEEV